MTSALANSTSEIYGTFHWRRNADHLSAKLLSNADLRPLARFQHENIRSGFTEGLNPHGKLFGLPPHIQRQFEIWDKNFTGGEERKLVEAMKKKMTEINLNTENYIKDAAQQKTAQFQLELAMRAANKTVSGIQQLLSAQ